MDYIILDLEWNSGYCKKKQGYINEIIEWGAVRLDERMKLIGQFSMFIRPAITRRLNPTVRRLTHLTNEDLTHGAPFAYAASKFARFAQNSVIMSWSTSDLNALQTNYEYHTGSRRIPFLHFYADVQAYCQSRLGLGIKNQLSLSAAAEQAAVSVEDIPLHRAVGDSILTARILQRLYDPQFFVSCVKTVNDEFYARLNFHNTYLTDPAHPQVKLASVRLRCPQCGAEAAPSENWKAKNKAFFNMFQCSSCHNSFRGRVQYKLCYDGIVVNRRVLPEVTAEQPEQDEQAAGSGDKEQRESIE